MLRLVPIACVLVTGGCGGVYVTHISSGDYPLEGVASELTETQLHTQKQFEGITLSLDVTAKTGTLASSTIGPIAITLTALPTDRWVPDCFTKNSNTLNEAFRVSPAPLTIGALTIVEPLITTKCGGRLMLGAEATGGRGATTLAEPIFLFHPP